MPTTTLTKTPRSFFPVGTTFTAVTGGSYVRVAISLPTQQGGQLLARLRNGTTGPTAQAVMNVLACNEATRPAVAATSATQLALEAGSPWRSLFPSVGNGTAANALTDWSWDIPPGVMHLCIEVGGNTGQDVTGDATFGEITSAVTA